MTLDHFEQALLTDLRGHVAERAAAPDRSRRWRWAAVPVGVAGVAVAVGIALMQPSAAYAVSESGDDVVVTIKRLDDAAGLERALAEHGIDAEVDYSAEVPELPAGDGTHAESGTGEHGDDGPSLTGPGSTSGGTGDPGAPGGPRADITTSLSQDGFTMRIDPETLPDDGVLHITTSGSADGVSGIQVIVTDPR